MIKSKAIAASSGQSNWTTSQSDVDMAWSLVRGQSNVAREFGVDKATVRSARLQSSCASMELTLDLLRDLKAKCLLEQPLLVVSGIKFDEAEQKLSLDLGSDYRRQHTQSGWKTFLSRQRLVICWPSGVLCNFGF